MPDDPAPWAVVCVFQLVSLFSSLGGCGGDVLLGFFVCFPFNLTEEWQAHQSALTRSVIAQSHTY